jgi:putative oxidoreductase
MRLCLGAALIYNRIDWLLHRDTATLALVGHLIAAASGILLLVGLWTPLAGGLAALQEAGQTMALYSTVREAAWMHAFLAVLSLSVAMLGPGAWSIDARLFGRRRFDLDRTRSKRP